MTHRRIHPYSGMPDRHFWRHAVGSRHFADLDALWEPFELFPLMATASNEHVLVATTQSKSILRAVAGEFCENTEAVHYFPLFEINNSPQARGMAFDPDQRSVNQFGVDLVMKHFFTGCIGREFTEKSLEEDFSLIYDEELLGGLNS